MSMHVFRSPCSRYTYLFQHDCFLNIVRWIIITITADAISWRIRILNIWLHSFTFLGKWSDKSIPFHNRKSESDFYKRLFDWRFYWNGGKSTRMSIENLRIDFVYWVATMWDHFSLITKSIIIGAFENASVPRLVIPKTSFITWMLLSTGNIFSDVRGMRISIPISQRKTQVNQHLFVRSTYFRTGNNGSLTPLYCPNIFFTRLFGNMLGMLTP